MYVVFFKCESKTSSFSEDLCQVPLPSPSLSGVFWLVVAAADWLSWGLGLFKPRASVKLEGRCDSSVTPHPVSKPACAFVNCCVFFFFFVFS